MGKQKSHSRRSYPSTRNAFPVARASDAMINEQERVSQDSHFPTATPQSLARDVDLRMRTSSTTARSLILMKREKERTAERLPAIMRTRKEVERNPPDSLLEQLTP